MDTSELEQLDESQEVCVEMLNGTVQAQTEEMVCSTNQSAYLVYIYPTGPGMGTRFTLGDAPMTIGRSTNCQIQTNDHSVSRRHVQIEKGPTGYRAVDLGSTNGTFVNKVRAAVHELQDGDYLQVGKCIYRYLAGGNVESEYHEEIYRLTIIDGLTNIHNKRYLLEYLEGELARSSRYSRPLSLILFDIDRFKLINDQLGHLAGDFILRELATRIRAIIRREELFARYGGEEFAVVLPEATPPAARQAAERIRQMVEQHSFVFDNQRCPVTISAGIAHTMGVPPLSPHELIALADQKLYQAKHEGRNRVML